MDDDIALSLPDPPPPAPARREAAIGEALRRFDAAGEPPRAAREPRPKAGTPPWWTRINRPATGALATVALVALIGVPTAWLSVRQRPVQADHEIFASADGPDARASVTSDTLARPSPPKLDAAPPPSAVMPAPAPAAAPPLLAETDEAPCRTADCAPVARALAKSNEAAPSAAEALAQGSAAMPPETSSRSRPGANVQLADAAMRFPPAAMVAPPPPPRAAPAASPRDTALPTDKAASSIVVTARRKEAGKSPGRGDWNACTVDDPQRSLGSCKRLVDPGRAGPRGRAAADLADGLSRAWRGDLDGAVAAFDRAIEMAPRLSLAYLNRGLAFQRKGDLDRAIIDLDRAVRYAPGLARGYYARSVLLRQRGDDARADADAQRALDIDPRYAALVE